MWLPPHASYNLLLCQTHSVRQISAFYSHFQVTSGQMTSLPSHFWSPEVRDVISCHVTAFSCELQPCMKSNAQCMSFRPSTATSRWLPVKWRHFRSLAVPEFTWHHFLSRDCLLLRATALYKVKRTEYESFRLLQPLPGDFPSNYVTSSHLRLPEFTWRHFLSRDCLLLRATALYEVKRRVYASFRPSTATSKWLPIKWHHFRVTSDHLRSRGHFLSRDCLLLQATALYVVQCTVYDSLQPAATSRWLLVKWRHFRSLPLKWVRDVISCHVTASSCKLQPCMKSNAQCTPVFGFLQPLPGDFRSNDVTSGHFQSPQFMSRHFLSRDCLLLRATALY